MTKAKFFYINRNNARQPKESFIALKLSLQTKRKLYPHLDDDVLKKMNIMYPQDLPEKDKIFIYGVGYVKFGKTNKVEVPVFSGEIEDWDDYLEKYGKHCLYYSLTGELLNSGSFVHSEEKKEFDSIFCMDGCYDYGIRDHQKFVEKALRIEEIQNEVLDKLFDNKYLKDKLRFKPVFSIFGCPLIPMYDSLNDDGKLHDFYVEKRLKELYEQHPKFNEIETLELKMDCVRDACGRRSHEYNKLIEKYDEMYTEIKTDNMRIINKELIDVFPVSVSDRMKMLYGEECEKLYESVISTNFIKK